MIENEGPIVGQLPTSADQQITLVNHLDIDGIQLETYATQQKLTHNQIWDKVKSGQLIARTQQGKIYIYHDVMPEFNFEDHGKTTIDTTHLQPAMEDGDTNTKQSSLHEGHTLSGLPPLPSSAASFESKSGFLGLSGKFADSPEVALLLDHLSLAKEENREVLKLAQESIRTMTDTTEKVIVAKDQLISEKDKMLAQKDEVISDKEKQLKLMQDKLDQQEALLRKAQQDAEDMETLARTLTASN